MMVQLYQRNDPFEKLANLTRNKITNEMEGTDTDEDFGPRRYIVSCFFAIGELDIRQEATIWTLAIPKLNAQLVTLES
jgi:hypothetical protein